MPAFRIAGDNSDMAIPEPGGFEFADGRFSRRIVIIEMGECLGHFVLRFTSRRQFTLPW